MYQNNREEKKCLKYTLRTVVSLIERNFFHDLKNVYRTFETGVNYRVTLLKEGALNLSQNPMPKRVGVLFLSDKMDRNN